MIVDGPAAGNVYGRRARGPAFGLLCMLVVATSACTTVVPVAPSPSTLAPEPMPPPPAAPSIDPVWLDAPIDQLLLAREDLCVRKGSNLYCVSDVGPESRFQRVHDAVVRAALLGSGPTPCWTGPDALVRCDGVEIDLRDPSHNLTASERTLCAWDDEVIRCRLNDSPFENTGGKTIEIPIPDAVGAVVSIALYDDFDRTHLAAVGEDGAVHDWWDIRAPAGSSPKRRALPPMATFRVAHGGWAGVTKGGQVLFEERVIGIDDGHSTLCGVNDAQAVELGMFLLCARTSGGVVCASHMLIDEPDWRAGPLHEPCSGPLGSLARPDVTQLAMHQLGPVCFGDGVDVYCTGDGLGDDWLAQRPIVHRGAIEIASGADFNCARLVDERVVCAGPSHGPLGHGEELPEAAGADRIFAGEHTLCAFMVDATDARRGKLRCWVRSGTKDEPHRGVWTSLRPLAVGHVPDDVLVHDSGVAWHHAGRAHVYGIESADRNERAPWLLEPPARSSSRRFVRARGRGPELAIAGATIVSRSGAYYLLDDGSFFSFQRKGLTGPAIAFGLLTGAVFIPFLEAGQPQTRVDHELHPGTVELAAGYGHVCQRTERGEVACFGFDDDGRIGAMPGGSYVSSRRPVVVPLNAAATSIRAGQTHTCALLEGGDVQCWGDWGFRLIRAWDQYPAWSRIAPPLAPAG